MMKRILVLGSEGQIGSSLCDELEKSGYEVYKRDLLLSPRHDLRHRSWIHEDGALLLQKIDFIYFLAFDVGGSTYLKNYQDTYDFIHNNVSLMKEVFSTINEHKIPFIFASSQMSSMIHSTYGLLKAVGERYSKSLSGKIVHFWNVYGEEPDLNKAHVITDFVRMALDGEIKMRTTGVEKRQFLYSEDCSKGLIKLMENYSSIPEVSHLTSFEWTTVKEVAEIIASIIPCTITPGDLMDEVQKMIVNDPNTEILSMWKPEVSMKEGISRIVEFEKKRG